MARIYINKTHPNFFKVLLATALTHLSVGLLLLYGMISMHKITIIGLVFIISFVIIAITMFYGLLAPHYRFVRYSLIGGLFTIGFLSLAFLGSVLLSLGTVKTQELAWLLPPWAVWGFLQYASLLEPPENPLSEGIKRSNDGQ